MRAHQVTFVSLLFFLSSETLWAGPPAGRVVGWGRNESGKATGTPSLESSTGGVTFAGKALTDVVAIAAGDEHSLALMKDGTVRGWGWNLSLQAIGFESERPHYTNGIVTLSGQVLSNVTSIAAGWRHSLALKSDGKIASWGTKVPAGLSNVVSIAAGGTHDLVLKDDGTVVEWGMNNHNEAISPTGLSNVVAIATGAATYSPCLALKRDGTLVQWYGSGVQEAVAAGLTNVKAIAVGYAHCLALKSDGTVIGWGSDKYAATIPKGLAAVQAIAAGDGFSLALKDDGTVAAWGSMDKIHPATVPEGLRDVVAIAAGQNFCLAITTNQMLAERFRNSASPK